MSPFGLIKLRNGWLRGQGQQIKKVDLFFNCEQGEGG